MPSMEKFGWTLLVGSNWLAAPGWKCCQDVLARGSIKYGCRIYQDRPQDCRHYPVSIADMVRDDCEMIENCDIEAPKEAQITLDQLMADSRQPLS